MPGASLVGEATSIVPPCNSSSAAETATGEPSPGHGGAARVSGDDWGTDCRGSAQARRLGGPVGRDLRRQDRVRAVLSSGRVSAHRRRPLAGRGLSSDAMAVVFATNATEVVLAGANALDLGSASPDAWEKLNLPLARMWIHEALCPPAPAWPEPGKELHRLDFDYAFQPVVAGGMVYRGRRLTIRSGRPVSRTAASSGDSPPGAPSASRRLWPTADSTRPMTTASCIALMRRRAGCSGKAPPASSTSINRTRGHRPLQG